MRISFNINKFIFWSINCSENYNRTAINDINNVNNNYILTQSCSDVKNNIATDMNTIKNDEGIYKYKSKLINRWKYHEETNKKNYRNIISKSPSPEKVIKHMDSNHVNNEENLIERIPLIYNIEIDKNYENTKDLKYRITILKNYSTNIETDNFQMDFAKAETSNVSHCNEIESNNITSSREEKIPNSEFIKTEIKQERTKKHTLDLSNLKRPIFIKDILEKYRNNIKVFENVIKGNKNLEKEINDRKVAFEDRCQIMEFFYQNKFYASRKNGKSLNKFDTDRIKIQIFKGFSLHKEHINEYQKNFTFKLRNIKHSCKRKILEKYNKFTKNPVLNTNWEVKARQFLDILECHDRFFATIFFNLIKFIFRFFNTHVSKACYSADLVIDYEIQKNCDDIMKMTEEYIERVIKNNILATTK